MRELYKTLERYTDERTRDNERKVVSVEDGKTRDAKWFTGRIRIHQLAIVVFVAIGLSEAIGWAVTSVEKGGQYDDLMAAKKAGDDTIQAHLETIAAREEEIESNRVACESELADAGLQWEEAMRETTAEVAILTEAFEQCAGGGGA